MTGKRRAGRDPVRRPARPDAPLSPPVVISPRPSRREERQLRRREQRKRFGFAGGGVALVIGLILIATLVIGGVKAASNGGGSTRSQVTALLQIQASNRAAIGSVLLAHDPKSDTERGLEVLVPSRLITDVCGYGSQNFGDILALPNGVNASRAALSSVLDGVTVDGSWILSTGQFAKLVDAIGGINVNVDTNVVQRTAGGGGRILVPAGQNRHLSGAQAVEYLSYQPSSDRGAAAQLARLQSVVDTTIQGLPHTVTAVQALLRGLGPGGTSTLGSGKLAGLLLGIADDDKTAAGVFPTDLPTTPIDAGGSIPSYQPDDSATGIPSLVKTHLANSLPSNANSQHATVYLLNGTGQVGLVGTACSKLARAGFTYAGSDNAPSFSNARSEVEVFSNSEISQGRSLARALGLPASDVRRGTANQNIARFVVVLGGDYKP